MSKSSMQLKDILWNSIPDTGAQAAGSWKLWKLVLLYAESSWAINLVFLREGAYPILTGNLT